MIPDEAFRRLLVAMVRNACDALLCPYSEEAREAREWFKSEQYQAIASVLGLPPCLDWKGTMKVAKRLREHNATGIIVE